MQLPSRMPAMIIINERAIINDRVNIITVLLRLGVVKIVIYLVIRRVGVPFGLPYDKLLGKYLQVGFD